MSQSLSHPISSRCFLSVLIALAAFVVFFELGRMDIVTDNEAQRATPPAEMLRSGDYIIPTINGMDYLVKPPLLYWAIAATYRATGLISETTARLPTALCAIGIVLAIYLIVRDESHESAAQWAALAMLASPFFLERARWANLDIPFTLALFLAIMAMRAASKTDTFLRAAPQCGLAGLAFGAALLIKGPPAFLFLFAAWLALLVSDSNQLARALRTAAIFIALAFLVSLTLFFFRLLGDLLDLAILSAIRLPLPLLIVLAGMTAVAWRAAGRRSRWNRLALLASIMLIGIAIAAPWSAAVLARRGWPYILELLQNQVFERTYTASRINRGDPSFYLIRIIGMTAPWGFLLPLHFIPKLWRGSSPIARFGILTGWSSILIFTLIAGKESEYVLPAVPFLMIATGYHLAGIARGAYSGRTAGFARIWLRAMLLLLILALLGGVVWYATTEKSPVLWTELALIAALALSFTFAQLRLSPFSASIPAQMRSVVLLTLASSLVFLVGRSYYFSLHEQRTPKHLGHTCRALIEAGYRLEAIPPISPGHPFPFQEVAFYIGHPIPTEGDPARIIDKLADPEPYYYLTRERSLGLLAEALGTTNTQTLLGPTTRKDLILLGNQPLPDPLPQSPLAAPASD